MFKKLYAFTKGYRILTIATPVFVVIESLIEIYIPLIMANLIDKGISVGDMGMVTRYGIILLVAAFVSLLFGIAAAVTAPYASSGFAKNLRETMYYRVQEFSFTSIDKFSTASIVTRLTTDVTNVQQSFQMLIRVFTRAPGMLIFALVAAFRVNSSLALVFAVSVPILFVGIIVIMKTVHPIFERVFKTYDKLNSVVQENVRGMRVVKSFNGEERESEKFNAISGSIFKDFSKAEKTMAWMMPLVQASMYISMILLFMFGSKMIVDSGNDELLGLTTGQLMSMITYTAQILMSLMMLSVIFVMLIMSKASAERIVELLDEKSDLGNPEAPVFEIADGAIDFDKVSFEYVNFSQDRDSEDEAAGTETHRKVLDSVNLSIKSGETIGIVGATGSAKSSLVQLIPRLYDVSEGSVKVGGRDVREYDLETLRNAVSVVLQKNILFSGTIADNLRWGDIDADIEDMKRVCAIAKADEFIDSFPEGYEYMVEQGGDNLSGGQKQRLCIARALLKKPKILIMDDSTSAVDTKTDASIRNALRNQMPGVTKLIIAQRIQSIMDSDRIIVLDGGKISGFGTHDELLNTNEIYREIYETQTKQSSADAEMEGGEL